ncbi:MAG: LOG family protein [Proteobacteria bacterium]|nr:LOG family protein [Pseudomonadota bacterium]
MPDNDAQRTSQSYRLAIADVDFLLRDELRAQRFALEFSKADLALKDWGIRSTVIVFGSARVPSPEQTDALREVAAGSGPAAAAARKRLSLAPWYDEACRFARIVSERGGSKTAHRGFRDNVIATGGGPGIMEAANRGAAEVGAPSIGFNITLPTEQQPNAYSTPELTFRFHYFAMRKMHLAMRANALAVFPGGFGTFDELFEILTLQQTRKAPPTPVVLFGASYWRRIINFEALVEAGTIADIDLGLFDIVDDAESGWNAMLRRGLGSHIPPPDEPTDEDVDIFRE